MVCCPNSDFDSISAVSMLDYLIDLDLHENLPTSLSRPRLFKPFLKAMDFAVVIIPQVVFTHLPSTSEQDSSLLVSQHISVYSVYDLQMSFPDKYKQA